MRRIIRLVLALLVFAGLGYMVYVGVEGSRQLVSVDELRSRDCRTPQVQFGWDYEPINYDGADDARLEGTTGCASQGTPAGDAVITPDRTRIAGWYIPAGNGAGPDAPTVVLVHGHGQNKSSVLKVGTGLHEEFNLVAFDLRNGGRSTGTATTMGVYERQDLAAILDWLEAEKRPERIGVLGSSMGGVTALATAIGDHRIEALILDSVHARVEDNLAQRLPQHGHPSYPGAWAILMGARIRAGVDVGEADPIDTIGSFDERPLLFLHGTADDEDLPQRAEDLLATAIAAGIPAELKWCEGGGHGNLVDICAEYEAWTHDFFTETLARP